MRRPRPNIGYTYPQLPSTPTVAEHGLGLAWDNAAGAFVWAPMGGGGGGAPVGAQYLTLALDGTLTNERRLDPGIGLVAVDGGAGADYDLRFGYAGEADGDLTRRSGGAWGRLGIGSAGDVLTVSGGLPTWAAPAVPAHTALSALAWTASGHTGTAQGAAGFTGAGAAQAIAGTPGQVLGWDGAGALAALTLLIAYSVLEPSLGCGWDEQAAYPLDYTTYSGGTIS